MSNAAVVNIFRFFILALIQIIILKPLSTGWEGKYFYINFILYPLFIMLLPLRTPQVVLLFSAFAMGLLVDMGYDSWGVHAGASVLSAYLRSFILKRLEPRDGYNVGHSPVKARMGMNWFLRYSILFLSAHLLFYFSLEAFSPVFFGQILLKTANTLAFSMIFVIIVVNIFDPKE